MGDLLTLHVAKISKIIKSCQTKDQLFVTKKVINNFVLYWSYKPINPIVFNKHLIYLSVLYNSKKISLRYEQ